MKKIYSILLTLFIFISLIPMPASAAFIWTEQVNSGMRDWAGVASSADGTKLVAVVGGGYIYTSADSGATWTQQTNSGNRFWRRVTISSDGTKIAATTSSDYIYTSTDSGATWTQQTNSGSRDWYGIASSSDGTKLSAVVQGGYIYTSADSGATWTEQTNPGSRNWSVIASSSDGTKLSAAVQGGYVYTSTNSGATWTEQTNSGSRNWYGIASSSDGTKLSAAVNGGYIYTSSDSGATWTEQTNSGSRNWYGIASSSDGAKIISGVDGGYVYTSGDSGVTWEVHTFSSGYNTRVGSSSDGTKLIAATYNHSVYTSVSVVAPTITTGSSSSITATTATLGGNITDTGGENNTARGIHYGLTAGYGSTASDSGSYGTGAYTKNITGLTCNTLYHYRAFSINSAGTTNGSDSTFTTAACAPTITTGSSSSITTTTATLGGDITNTGGENNTARGIEYGLTTGYGSTSSDSGSYGTGAYTKDITGLTCNTLYHYRAFSTNTAGTTNGSDDTFTTLACPNTKRYGSSSSFSSVSYTAPAVVSQTPAAAPAPLEKKCPNPLTQKLKSGARDGQYHAYTGGEVKEVKVLQGHMNRLGYGTGKVDGVFGKNTKSAIMKMQKFLGLKQDGIVGVNTRDLINDSCKSSS